MEYKINEIPFPMHQITAKLFNLEYLSDITFLVEGEQMFAHSLILMVRSTTFQKQLETTLGEKKIIPITDYGYDIFYQFIRFLYTDEINANGANWKSLLKMAIQYNVIKLINKLMNGAFSPLQKLDLYKVGNNKIDLNRKTLKLQVAFLSKSSFRLIDTVSSGTIEEVLKFDQLQKDVTESYILDALVHWMNQYCQQNHIQFSDCCKKFPDLITSIRFPTMSNEELRNIKTKYPDILTESDFTKFANHKIYGTALKDGIWNCSPRTELLCPYEFNTYPGQTEFKTKFSVYSEMVLHGFAFGKDYDFIKRCHTVKRMNITISCKQNNSSNPIELNIDEVDLENCFCFINLGKSIRLRPNLIYSIGYKYKIMDNATKYSSRKSQTNFIVNAPPNSVEILEVHPTMLEITFINPEDDNI